MSFPVLNCTAFYIKDCFSVPKVCSRGQPFVPTANGPTALCSLIYKDFFFTEYFENGTLCSHIFKVSFTEHKIFLKIKPYGSTFLGHLKNEVLCSLYFPSIYALSSHNVFWKHFIVNEGVFFSPQYLVKSIADRVRVRVRA